MRNIHLHRVIVKGFKSLRDTTVELSDTPGFKFMSGDNKVEPALGANGAGKSSLWDAIIWCFYGLSAKGLRASELVTWGEKRCEVTVHIWIDGVPKIIRRHSNPMKIYSIGEWSADYVENTQADIDLILGLNYQRFMHSVVFGQAIPLFPDLSIPDRATLLEDVLNLGLWARLAERTSKQCATYEADLVGLNLSLATATGSLEAVGDAEITRLEEEEAGWQNKLDIEIETSKLNISKLQANHAIYTKLCNAREHEVKDAKEAYEDAQKELDTLNSGRQEVVITKNQWQVRADDAHNLMSFYQDHSECPTCQQRITKDFRGPAIEAKKKELEEAEQKELKYANSVASFDAEIKKLSTMLQALRDIWGKAIGAASTAKAKLEQCARDLHDAIVASTRLIGTNNPYAARLTRLREQRKENLAKISKINRLIFSIRRKLAAADWWRIGWKKLRLDRMNATLKYLELETAAAAESLGLKGWQIEYVTEVETKSGGAKLGVQIIVTSPTAKGTWESWSGGESQRCRVAVALGMATMIQRMSGVIYGWEVWDEPSAWLSAEGIEDLLTSLADRALRNNSSIWLCDHRALASTGFSEVWQATKTTNGTEVKQL